VRVDSDDIQIEGPAPDGELLELNEALDELAVEQPVKAEAVKLKFFAGLNEKEIADLLGMTERTVQRYWAFSQVWLFDRIHRK
jgi:DNA-directed RNA polymerase specialized sigma24 family protein